MRKRFPTEVEKANEGRNLSPDRIIKTGNLLKRVTLLFFGVLLALWIVSSLISYIQLKRLLKDHQVISNVVMVKCRIARGSSHHRDYRYLNYQYTFEVNGEIYDGTKEIVVKAGIGQDRFNDHLLFPVAYQTDNPNNQRLLATPADFKLFQLPYPDSLQWLRPLLSQK